MAPSLACISTLAQHADVNYLIARYPDLAEFRAMLEGWSGKGSWNGKHFLTTLSEEKGPTFTLWLRQNDVGIDFTENEWSAVHELFQKAWAIPELQRWVQELQWSMANRVDSAKRGFAPRFARSGAYGTGSWTDTSPPNGLPHSNQGCCMGTC